MWYAILFTDMNDSVRFAYIEQNIEYIGNKKAVEIATLLNILYQIANTRTLTACVPL